MRQIKLDLHRVSCALSMALVTGHPHGRKGLLTLRHTKKGEPHPRQVNIEKIFVVPDLEPDDLRPLEEALVEPDLVEVEKTPRNAISDIPTLH